jgi:formate-dependent nitrite reductase cytochrome c552 subunit
MKWRRISSWRALGLAERSGMVASQQVEHVLWGWSQGTRDCATCHMPQVELPGGHAKFTDHPIRVARAGEGYPD